MTFEDVKGLNYKAKGKGKLTWNARHPHLTTASGQGERDQYAIEQRLCYVAIQMSDAIREGGYVVGQSVVRILDSSVQIWYPVVYLIGEIHFVRMGHQSCSATEIKLN